MRDMIVVENLVKKFKDVTAVNNVSFTVKKGEIFGSLGSNRASKTTIIHIKTTLLKPTTGKVVVSDIVVSEKPQLGRERLE